MREPLSSNTSRCCGGHCAIGLVELRIDDSGVFGFAFRDQDIAELRKNARGLRRVVSDAERALHIECRAR